MMASAPPVISVMVPGAMLPAPTAPSNWSMPPVTANVPVARPVACAPSRLSGLTISPGCSNRPNCSAPMPAASSTGVHHRLFLMSSSNEDDCTLHSVTYSPVRRWSRKSSTSR